jgi:hypothetical protein
MFISPVNLVSMEILYIVLFGFVALVVITPLYAIFSAMKELYLGNEDEILKESERKRKKFIDKQSKEKALKNTQNKKIICQHCGAKGGVTTRKGKIKEESREKGLIGATIGRKEITSREATILHCSKCGLEWSI